MAAKSTTEYEAKVSATTAKNSPVAAVKKSAGTAVAVTKVPIVVPTTKDPCSHDDEGNSHNIATAAAAGAATSKKRKKKQQQQQQQQQQEIQQNKKKKKRHGNNDNNNGNLPAAAAPPPPPPQQQQQHEDGDDPHMAHFHRISRRREIVPCAAQREQELVISFRIMREELQLLFQRVNYFQTQLEDERHQQIFRNEIRENMI